MPAAHHEACSNSIGLGKRLLESDLSAAPSRSPAFQRSIARSSAATLVDDIVSSSPVDLAPATIWA
jgi:hypothetical protein